MFTEEFNIIKEHWEGIFSKEQEVSTVKEKQKMAKEQSLQKEKTKSLDKGKGLELE